MKTLVLILISLSSFAQSLDFAVPRRSDFSAGYQAVVTRCLALSGCTLPSYSQQIAQDIKYNSLPISSLDFYYNFATDGNETFAQINWKTPASFQASPVASPTFTKNQGYYGNGTSSYVNTTWRPFFDATNYSQNNASFFVNVITNTAGSNTMAAGGTVGSSVINIIIPRNVSNLADFRINSASGFSDTQAVTQSNDLFMVQRLNSTQVSLWHKGVLLVTAAENSTGRSGNATYLEALNNVGTAGFFSSRGVSSAGAGNGLSGVEAALYTTEATYLNSILVWGNTSVTLGQTGTKFNN